MRSASPEILAPGMLLVKIQHVTQIRGFSKWVYLELIAHSS